jgi:hypothetical protein
MEGKEAVFPVRTGAEVTAVDLTRSGGVEHCGTRPRR